MFQLIVTRYCESPDVLGVQFAQVTVKIPLEFGWLWLVVLEEVVVDEVGLVVVAGKVVVGELVFVPKDAAAPAVINTTIITTAMIPATVILPIPRFWFIIWFGS